MQTIIFDIDHTIFDANHALHEGVVDLLALLQQLGLQVGAISNQDHRALVHLDEAGIRRFFSQVLCSDHEQNPKSTASFHKLLQKLGTDPHQTALVSHAHVDILLGKDAGVSKTIGVSHGLSNVAPLTEAGADHVVPNIPAVLDVIH